MTSLLSRSWLAALLLLAASPPAPAQVRVFEPPVFHVYSYLAYTPGSAFYGLWPAYTSVWPTYGYYRGGYYWPMYMSGTYAAGYTPWVYGYYPWAFNSYPVAGAWYGPYVYSFRSYDWRGYVFPWGIPYITPLAWSYPALQAPVAVYSAPVVHTVARVDTVPATIRTGPPPAPDALTLYSRAHSAYRNHEYSDALRLIDQAIEANANDPRFWYIKAVTERMLGKTKAAEDSAQRAAAVEVLVRPEPRQIYEALETVQGADRAWLRNVERLSLRLDQAREIAEGPVPSGVTRSTEGTAPVRKVDR